MSVFVDARFAGGTIEVATGSFLDDERIVILELPGMNAVPLFPHEARALADALNAEAATTETRQVRRPLTVNNHLRALDD